MTHAVVFNPDDFQKFLTELKGIAREEFKGYVVEKPMTAKQAADYLNVTEKTMWERIRKGKMPSHLIHRSAGSVYFLPSELYEYIKNS